MESSQKKLEKKPNSSKKGMTIVEVCQKIKEMIYQNKLAPGQRLICADIARQLSVSNTPIIQAFKMLETSNLVEYKQNRGYQIAEITEDEARQLYKAREALETHIIHDVIKNIDDKIIEDITKALKRYRDADQRMGFFVDAQFHLKVAEYAYNNVIYRILKDIFEQIYLKYRVEYFSDIHRKEAIKEHRRILEALRDRDEEKAVAMIKQHLSSGVERILRNLKAYEIPMF